MINASTIYLAEQQLHRYPQDVIARLERAQALQLVAAERRTSRSTGGLRWVTFRRVRAWKASLLPAPN